MRLNVGRAALALAVGFAGGGLLGSGLSGLGLPFPLALLASGLFGWYWGKYTFAWVWEEEE